MLSRIFSQDFPGPGIVNPAFSRRRGNPVRCTSVELVSEPEMMVVSAPTPMDQ